MNIGSFSIKYKYFVLTLAISIVLFGVYSKLTLKTQLSPDTNPPMATVITQYPGASAQDIANDVIEPMEDEFGKLEGIANIKSTGQDNMAITQLEFNYGVNIDQAAIDVQNAINKIRGKLPGNIEEPKVLKFSTSDKPVMTISLNSDSVNLQDVRELAEDKIGYNIQLVEGVGSVDIFGGHISEVQVKVDKAKMLSYNISLDSISKILAANNIKAPGGKLTDSGKEVLIRVEEGFTGIDEIKKIRMPLSDGNFVYLSDIADVSLSVEDLESTYRFKGKDAIAIKVIKRSDANTVDVVKKTKEKIEELKKEYPYIYFEVAQDDSIFTTQMVDNMTSSVSTSLILTILIIMLFISKLSQSMVVSVSMPLVLLTTLGLLKIWGMKLDLVTLSALILSIGFVVDASIIVVENIATHNIKYGKDIRTAAIDATQEIAMPSVAGALTTVIVLFPLIFIKGFVGEMFRPLSLTVIYSITASIIIAIIIIPLFTVLLSKFSFKRVERLTDILTIPFNRLMDKVLNAYIYLLKFSLRNKLIVYVVVIALVVLSGRLMMSRGIEMLPKFDSGVSYISVEMEPGTTLEETSRTVGIIEKILDGENNVMSYDTQIGFEKDSSLLSDFGAMGVNQAVITVNLSTRNERKETIWDFQERMRDKVALIPGISRFIIKEQGGTAVSGTSAPLDIRISGEDQEVLYKLAVSLEEKLEKVEGTTNIYKSFNMDNMQAIVKLDHSKIQDLGLNSGAVAQQIYSSMEGIKNTSVDIGEYNNLDVSVEYQDRYKGSLDSLLDSYIDTPVGVKVPLRELAEVQIGRRPNITTRENQEYTIDILGYTHNRAFSHITKDINKILSKFPLPTGYNVALTGEMEDMRQSMNDMVFSLLLAIVFVYLVLVPQFKSFIHPVTIMSAIPLVVIGVAPLLALAGKYISMPVLLGFILLAGTVVNNSILLIDFAVNLRQEGDTMEDTMVRAVKARFRPIMMTALSDVTGMLPLALQLALGAERFSPLAITVIGGIMAATLLTMNVIPMIYATFEGIKQHVINRQNKGSLTL